MAQCRDSASAEVGACVPVACPAGSSGRPARGAGSVAGAVSVATGVSVAAAARIAEAVSVATGLSVAGSSVADAALSVVANWVASWTVAVASPTGSGRAPLSSWPQPVDDDDRGDAEGSRPRHPAEGGENTSVAMAFWHGATLSVCWANYPIPLDACRHRWRDTDQCWDANSWGRDPAVPQAGAQEVAGWRPCSDGWMMPRRRQEFARAQASSQFSSRCPGTGSQRETARRTFELTVAP